MKKRDYIRWGLPDHLWAQLRFLKNKTFPLPHKMDARENCLLGPSWWDNYPVKDYEYRYNSIGFRADYNYDMNVNKDIILCIGDSNTLNLGGPIEHSWPYHLQQYFKIPVVNVSIDQMSYYYYADIWEKAHIFNNIKHTFILYSTYDRNDEPPETILPGWKQPGGAVERNLKDIKNNLMTPNTTIAFGPFWQYLEEERHIIKKYFPDAWGHFETMEIDCRKLDHNLLLSDYSRNHYKKCRQNDWPEYEEFVFELLKEEKPKHLFSKISDKNSESKAYYIKNVIMPVALRNRDGWHMSNFCNQELAKHMYNMYLKGFYNIP